MEELETLLILGHRDTTTLDTRTSTIVRRFLKGRQEMSNMRQAKKPCNQPSKIEATCEQTTTTQRKSGITLQLCEEHTDNNRAGMIYEGRKDQTWPSRTAQVGITLEMVRPQHFTSDITTTKYKSYPQYQPHASLATTIEKRCAPQFDACPPSNKLISFLQSQLLKDKPVSLSQDFFSTLPNPPRGLSEIAMRKPASVVQPTESLLPSASSVESTIQHVHLSEKSNSSLYPLWDAITSHSEKYPVSLSDISVRIMTWLETVPLDCKLLAPFISTSISTVSGSSKKSDLCTLPNSQEKCTLPLNHNAFTWFVIAHNPS